MSEIDGKSSELSFLSSFFADQENCSVAAAISSALETAAEEHSIISSHHNNSQLHHSHQQDPNQHFFQQPYNNHQQYNNNQINYTTDNNNHHCFRFGDLVKTTSGESIVNNFGQQQNHQQEPIYHPVAPYYDHGHHQQQQYENDYHQQQTHNINSNNHQPTLLSCNTNSSIGSAVAESGGSRRSGSTIKRTVEGNHVSGGDNFTVSQSSCSQQYHQQKISTLSSQMADKQDYNSSPTSDKTTSSPVRDKSDNRETYQISHCKEKSTCDKREVDSGGGGGRESRGVFKPSSKIIDLPEKSTSSAHDHHHHHHHSSSRNKDSKIPVGIAVAWQRLVTTSSSTPGINSTMTTKAGEGAGGGKGKVGGANCNINITSKYPSRPSSATSLKSSTVKHHQQNNNNSNIFSSSNGCTSASNPNLSIGENTSDILSSRPMSACGDAVLGALGGVSYCSSPAASPVLSRPLPSSSVPPNIGFPTGSYQPSPYSTPQNPYLSPHHPHHRQAGMSPYLDYPYGVAAAAAAHRGFAVPSPLTNPHHHHSHPNLHPSYWGIEAPPPAPLLSPHIPSSPSGVASPADYLQQLSSLQHQQQQMHLHHCPQNPNHSRQQQHLLASAANRQISSSPLPSSPYGSATTTNQYLQFLYPPATSSSSSQEAATLAASVAAATAAMNKSPFYDHYFLQHQQNLLQQQHQQNQVNVNSSSNNSVNTNNSVTTSGAFDLLANNSSDGSSQQHRAIPMQVASPLNRTTTPQLSSSPTMSGEIRTPTPTTKSSSSSSVNLAATTTVAAAKAASSSTSNAAPLGSITSSLGGSGSAVSTFSLVTSTTTTTTISLSPSTFTSQNFLGSSQSSAVGAPPLTISSSSRPQQESCPSPSSLFLLHHQQQHPHLFASSSAALSPKSLTSSTPSPVTVHDFNSGLNVIISSSSAANNTVASNNNMAAATRKGATPSPVSLTPTRALLSPFPPGSPFCSSPIPSNNNNNGGYKELLLWKDDSSSVSKIKPIPINGQTRETHVRSSGSRHASGGSSLSTPPPLCSPLLSIAHHNNMKNNKAISVSTPMSSPSGGQKHDFKRLESLIERRDSESISPLVLYPQHSPATSTASSVVDPDETFQQIGRPLEHEQDIGITRDDDEDEMETFRVSVKLEKAECEVHQQDNEREVDESFKVKPLSACKVREMVRHTDHEDGHADQKAEDICMKESDEENKEKADAVKGKFLSPIIKACDDSTNPRKRQAIQKDDLKTHRNETVEGNDVPESTLPLLSSSMSRCISNYDNSFTDDDDSNKRNGKKASNLTTIKNNKHHEQQTANYKDISFTSGYSSSHDDKNDHTFTVGKQSTSGTGKQKKPKKSRGEQQMSPSLKLASYKIKNQKKDKKNAALDKANKKQKEKAPKKEKDVVKSLEKPMKTKKTLKVGSDVAKKVNKKKGNEKVHEDTFSSNLKEKKTKKKYTRKNSETDVINKQSEKNKNAIPKKGKLTEEVVSSKNKRGNKGVKQTKMDKHGSINRQQQSWAPTSSPEMTNCGQQQFVNSSGSYFVSTNVTITGGSSGDISCTASGNTDPDQSNSSLTSNPIQPPPMAVLLHHPIHQPSSSAATTALHSPATQVTFLITSPDRTSSGATSPLRIPAYIPRSGTATSTNTNASVEDLVGESYNGPATLTLHRDVDAAAVVSPQTSYYSHPPNHPPPAITIQYHHSAPSTPLTMEAASPSSLDLLATVAQEFGSREDLGKRHSIDGGSSCNTSILGESPPMSPQKSPASYHHPTQHPNHFPHQFSSNPSTSTVSARHVSTTTSQKSVPPPVPIVVPPLPKPILSCVTSGKRPKSPKKTQSKSPRKSPERQNKTSNSITIKQTSKKTKKIIKAGKKEKRTVSDSAAVLYTPPVVYLKIPQVPGLCSKKKGSPAVALQEKTASLPKKNKAKVKTKVVEKLSKKLSKVNNTNKDKPALSKLNKSAKSKDGENIDILKKKTKSKTEKKTTLKQSPCLPLNVPTSSVDVPTKCKAEKEKERKRSSTTVTAKKEKKNKLALVDGEIISTSLPLKTTPATKSTLPTFSKDYHHITGNLTTTATTPSPTKEKPSSFYNPPERISAFAKQVISRRSSTLSPTKPSINNNGNTTASSNSVFFPTQQKEPLLPNSPTIKMPQLTPYDVLSPPTSTSPDFFNRNDVATASIMPLSDSGSRDSSQTSSTVPKGDNLKRFPTNSSGSSSSHLPPPLLLPSVSCKDKKDYCDDVNDDNVKDIRKISMISGHAEQGKKKTDRHRSPISGNKISVKGKKKKDNGQFLEAEDESAIKKKKRKRRLSSSQDGDDNDDHPTRKNDEPKKKTKKKNKHDSLPKSKKVSKITFSTSHSATASTRNAAATGPSYSLAFSPLTPPLTAKFSSSSLEGDEIGKEPRKSAFASLQVPHSGSTTPCSSLHSCKSSSPSCCVNVEDSGETETENENDLNNVWVADPMFAVSAIKVSTLSSPVSNQPTDVEDEEEKVEESVQEDDNDANADVNLHKHKKVVGGSFNKSGSKPPKLSLSVQQQKALDRESVVDVNSQFSKAFVHFKPKQLTGNGNKKGNHGGIKPCLKAEPIIVQCSLEENDEDVVEVENDGNDDEDFQLDMEVANITTKNNNRNQGQNAPKKVEKAATSSTTSATTTTTFTAANKKNKPSINRNSSSYLVKHQSLSTKEIMTKVFSRKLSPDLNERKSKMKRRRSSTGVGVVGAEGTEMDADDEDDEEEELLDIETPSSSSIFCNKSSHQSSINNPNPHVSMSAAAQAVIVNNNTNQSSASSTPALSSSSLALLSTSPMKKPKKRSARSSTTSSCASTKSSSQRGNRGQSSGGGGVSASASSSTSTMTRAATSASCASSSQQASKDEIQLPGKVELDSVGELVDEMRILTDIQGLFYTGRLNALQPPDVYGVTLDNERGAPPHLIFSAEEVLEKCLREKKPQNDGLRPGLRICAYWSPQYSGLYPGRVSSDFSPKFDPDKDLIPIEFDDGDTGMIKLKEIRLLSVNHPVREYDPNPLLTLEKKHRKRRHSSATGTSGGCTGEHEEPDCGEPYCAKIGKLEEDDEDDDGENDDEDSGGGHGGGGLQHHQSKMLYWTWSGLGYKRPKSKKNRNKEFFHGIQRGNEVINVGDAALFISTGNERPFIGRVERFWEQKGKKMVNVRWFYHPEEVKASAKRLSNLKYPGALFESPHIDENDVQTIAKKCDVLPFHEFKQRLSGTSAGSLRPAKLSMKSSSKPRDMYYVAGYYDPYTYNLTLKDLK